MRESTQTLAWYDRLAALYNLTRDYPYGTARKRAIDRLALSPGECVFDLFCGTGVNLPLLHERVSPAGRVVYEYSTCWRPPGVRWVDRIGDCALQPVRSPGVVKHQSLCYHRTLEGSPL